MIKGHFWYISVNSKHLKTWLQRKAGKLVYEFDLDKVFNCCCMKLKLSEEVFIKYFDWVKYFAEVIDYFLLYWIILRFFLKFSLSSFCYISYNSLNKSISIEVKIMIPFCTYSTMDDVLIEMEAIREFVVESLAEFRSELSAMN